MAQEKRINLKVSEELHARLKVLAAKDRTTMQAMINAWLAEKAQEAEWGGNPAAGTS